jgi:hypothetical protein
VKVLFVMRHPAAVRSLGSVLRLFDERGHCVHLVFGGGGPKPEAHRVLQGLADESRALTFGRMPGSGSPGWARDRAGWNVLAKKLRRDSDYLRYLEPRYADASALRARAEERADPAARRLARVAAVAGPRAVGVLRRTLELVERCLEPPPHVERFVADLEPDVVIVTHLARDSTQVDFVRAAKRLGIHTVYPVFSWDNLSNKGLVHEPPELVLVWNELQADEAVELQSLPRERVRVLGAWSYDHWFDWKPERSRGEFCDVVGLRADRPIVLYVCSSSFVAPDEVAFVRRWIGELRRHGGALAETGVVVRPHPRNAAQWAGVSLDDPQATVWPSLGEEPFEVVSRQNYFDSIYHSAAVVGINTSAQIESAIVGRPVHTLLAEEFRDTQQGTIHFQYLKADDFGHLHVGRTMAEHLEQLEESVRGRDDAGRNERFLRRFVRPLGLEVAASPLYVEAVEQLVAGPAPARDRGPLPAPLVRLALRPAARRAARRAENLRKQLREPADELRAVVRRLDRAGTRSPVLAAPWLGDEVGELLYWIPFLRWAQTTTYGLRDRLTVVHRSASAPWYAGIGARHLRVEELVPSERLAALAGSFPDGGVEDALGEVVPDLAGDAFVLLPSLVARSRSDLSAQDPDTSFRRRRLEFAPLHAGDAPAGLDLPAQFVAVGLAGEPPEPGPVVSLESLDRSSQAAVLGRSRGFVGPWGVEAVLAALVGVPSVVVGDADPDDLRVASSFLAEPPFGRIRTVGGAEAAEQIRLLLARPEKALARV